MIPKEPPPTLSESKKWSPEFQDFVSKCLVKDPNQRATASELLQVVLYIFKFLKDHHKGHLAF